MLRKLLMPLLLLFLLLLLLLTFFYAMCSVFGIFMLRDLTSSETSIESFGSPKSFTLFIKSLTSVTYDGTCLTIG